VGPKRVDPKSTIPNDVGHTTPDGMCEVDRIYDAG